jgi:hypothetical protein
MDGGGRDLRGSLPNSTSTDRAANILHGQGGTAMNLFLNDRDGLIQSVVHPCSRDASRAMGLSRAVNGVDTSGNEDSNNNDIEKAGCTLTGIFQTYTQDQLLAVYKHQGQDLNATITYIIGRGSEAPDCVVKNLANVLPSFSRT